MGSFFMTLNSFMKFNLLTLVDITETGAHRGSSLEAKQQANYITVIQTLGLRSNPTPIKLSQENKSITGIGFGSKYKGKQTVWHLEFEFEQEIGHTIEDILNDFALVPVIIGLNETAKINNSVFDTTGKETINLVINYVD
jgi:hypothetical protein